MICPNNPCRWGIYTFGFTDPSGQMELWVWRPQGASVNLGSTVPGRSGRLVANCNANQDFLDCAIMSNGVEMASKTAILE
jgi:anti-sigma-K factor RskA